MKNIRIITGYILVGLIVIFTVIAILGIWNIINFEDVVNNALKSFLVVFIASAVVLFITTVLIKDDEPKEPLK